MAYQKTAKDKAWDRERQKLQSDNHQWCIRCTSEKLSCVTKRLKD